MMRQFKAAKEQHPDAVLFFRMGDFYEMFLDDAELCSRVLGLTLTSRSKEQNLPMCGFPWKAASGYIRKMLAAGYKVAICEQIEDPAQAKGIVKREVIRVITPGTAFEDDLIGVDANYLGAIAKYRGDYAVAFLELSTGEMEVWPMDDAGKAIETVGSVMPSEVIVADGGERAYLVLRRPHPRGLRAGGAAAANRRGRRPTALRLRSTARIANPYRNHRGTPSRGANVPRPGDQA